MLLAEHRLERVVPFADRMCLLTGDGRVRVGEPADMLAHSPVVPPIVELGRAAALAPAAADGARGAAPGRRLARRSAPARRPRADRRRPRSTGRGLTVAHGRDGRGLRGVDLDAAHRPGRRP